MTPKTPRVSVIMPAYNAEHYVEAATRSILEQTFGDFEFIILDDGSTDSTGRILRRLALEDQRIILITGKNKGYSKCLNYGLSLCRGHFIARMDADDISLPERFALQLARMEASPELFALSGQWTLIDPKDRILSRNAKLPTEHAEIFETLRKGNGALPHPGVMMRAEVVREHGGYRTELEPAEDLDLWLRMADHGQLANLEETILRYRIHPKATSLVRRQEQAKSATRAVRESYERRNEIFPEDFRPNLSAPAKGPEIYRRWANTAMKNGELRTALIHAGSAILRRPQHLENWALLGSLFRFWRLGRAKKAESQQTPVTKTNS